VAFETGDSFLFGGGQAGGGRDATTKEKTKMISLRTIAEMIGPILHLDTPIDSNCRVFYGFLRTE
jgi:hypothetical protein